MAGVEGAGRRKRRRCGAGPLALAAFSLAGPVRGEDAVRALLFGSMDAGPSAFLSTGIKVAPDRIDREGFAALGIVGAGARPEPRPAAQGIAAGTQVRATALATVLGGYQFFREWGVVGLFAGPEAAFETLIDTAGVRMLPARYGLRLQGEVWARPSPETLATATLVLGSARWDAYGRVSAGYRVWGFYLGPEAFGYADRTGYQKWAVGLHATDFRYGRFSFRLSGGCAYEVETRQAGPYVALAAWAPL